MLDADAYGVSAGRGGTSSIGHAGTSSVGHAGTSSIGSAGRPGGSGGATSMPIAGTGSGASSGVDPTLATSVCQQYCPNYGTQCRKRLKGQECLPTCQGELTNFGPVCQNLGVNALRCLTPFFSPQGGDCDAAVNRALTQCGKVVDAFEACKKNFAPGTGTVSPNVASCPRNIGPDNSGSCTEVFDCANGPFVTFCTPSPQSMLLECGCAPPSGAAVPTGLLPFTADPCLAAAKLCR
jgi:hypothetical protein